MTEVVMTVTNFDNNNFGALDAFEACAREYKDHGLHTALECTKILFDAMQLKTNTPVNDAVQSLAWHLYTNGHIFANALTIPLLNVLYVPALGTLKLSSGNRSMPARPWIILIALLGKNLHHLAKTTLSTNSAKLISQGNSSVSMSWKAAGAQAPFQPFVDWTATVKSPRSHGTSTTSIRSVASRKTSMAIPSFPTYHLMADQNHTFRHRIIQILDPTVHGKRTRNTATENKENDVVSS